MPSSLPPRPSRYANILQFSERFLLGLTTLVIVGCSGSSGIGSSTTTLPIATATPIIAIDGTAYNIVRSVTITDGTPAATIHYTTDGSVPTASSLAYAGVFPISSSTTIKALATANSYGDSAVASALGTVPTTSPTSWDVTTVPGQVTYTEEVPLGDPSLASAGFINVVTQGGVDNTGTKDAACALSSLLNNPTLTHNNVQYGTAAPWQDLILFFPNGTYLLSDATCLPLAKNYSDGTPDYGLVFLGENQAGVSLKLAANMLPALLFSGNTTAGSRTISNVSSTVGLRVNQHLQSPSLRAGTTIAAIGSNSITLSYGAASTASAAPIKALTPIIFTQSTLQLSNGMMQQFGNEAFHNIVENLTLDLTAAGNSGASGISYLANNLGALRNLTISGDTSSAATGTGVDMTRPEIGPALLENLNITGFNRGIDVADNCCSITIEHITFDNQLTSAVSNADNLINANAIWIKTGRGSAAIINSTGDGMVTLSNSRIDQAGSTLVSNPSTAPGVVSIHNTSFGSAQNNLAGSSGTINGILKAQTWTPGGNFLLPLTLDTPVLPYDAASQWIAPKSGMSAQWTEQVTTPVDATVAINTALACTNGATSTFYLPHGVWYISSPIQIPSWVDRVEGMNSTIRVLPSAASKFPAGTPMFEVLSNSSGSCPFAPTVVIERLAFDTTGASTTGLYSVQALPPANDMVARTVVMRDNFSIGVGQMYRSASAGEVFLEDSDGSPARFDGLNYVFARQFNSESSTVGSSRITNNGAPLWVLGFKTEGNSNIVASLSNPATSEIIGGFFYTAPGSGGTVPGTTCSAAGSTVSNTSGTSATYIVDSGSRVESSFIEEADPTGTQTIATQTYPFYIWAAGNCQAGGSSATSAFSGAIQRTPIYAAPTESGFIVPELLAAP